MLKWRMLCFTAALLLCGCVTFNAAPTPQAVTASQTETSPGLVGLVESSFKPIPLFHDNAGEPFDYIIFTPKEDANGVFYELSRQSDAPLRLEYIGRGLKTDEAPAWDGQISGKDIWPRTRYIPGLHYNLAFRIIGKLENGRACIVADQKTGETCEIIFDPAVMEFRPWETFLQYADEVAFTGLPVYTEPGGHEIFVPEDLKQGRPGRLNGDWLEVRCWDGHKKRTYWLKWKDERGSLLSRITIFVG